MRRLFILVVVALLGITPVVIQPAFAQEGDPDWPRGAENTRWSGVSLPQAPSTEAVPAPPLGDSILQPYSIYFFEDYAAVPEITDFTTEFMVIVVQMGQFTLDVASSTEDGIVVFPAEDAAEKRIPLMKPVVGTSGAPEPPYYDATGAYLEVDGIECTRVCPVPAGEIVQVKPGDRVVAREGALCLYCLSNSNFTTTEEEHPTNVDDKGLLQVFPLLKAGSDPESFSWIQDWLKSQEGIGADQGSSATPSAQSGRQGMVGWAFFNPASNCTRG